MEGMRSMGTVIAFPGAAREGAGRSVDKRTRSRPDAGPVIVILPVVRIERHESPREAPVEVSTFVGTGPGSRQAR